MYYLRFDGIDQIDSFYEFIIQYKNRTPVLNNACFLQYNNLIVLSTELFNICMFTNCCLNFILVQIFLETQMPEKQYVKSLVAVNFRIQLLVKKLAKRLVQLNYDSYMKVKYQESHPHQNNYNQLKILEQLIFDLMKVLPQASSNQTSPNKENNKALSQQSTKSKIQKYKSSLDQINDKFVMQAMRKLMEVSENVGEFSQMLYNINGIKIENNQCINNSIPLQIYRSCRKIDETLHNTWNSLYSYQSHFQDFKRQKQILKRKQIQHYKKLEMKQNSPTNSRENLSCLGVESNISNRQKNDNNSFWISEKVSTLKPIQQEVSGSNQQIKDMSETIKHLQNIISLNNQDYRNQIYNYNRKIYDLESQIKILHEANNDESIQQSLIQLQRKISKLQQDKAKDKMLINNMANKIRTYQKMINGSDSFLNCPLTKRRHSRTNWKSADKLRQEIDQFLYRKSQLTENCKYSMNGFNFVTF